VISVPRKTHDSHETIKFPSGVVIPQVSETLAYIAIARYKKGESLELVAGGINEYQVSVGSSSGDHCIKEEVQKYSPRLPTAVGDYRTTVALQRAKTAREAVEIMGKLTDQFGARRDNYMIADPNEVWMWEEMQDRRWVAVKVPDDCFVVEANNRRITNVNMEDKENFMGSNDIISFTIEHGLYDPESGEKFSCAEVYSDNKLHMKYGMSMPKYNTRRIWGGIRLLAPSKNLDPEADQFPLFVKPDRKLTPKDLLMVLKDHYQGTKYDLYARNQDKYKYSTTYLDENFQYQFSPSWNTERIIGTSRSITSWVAQLRDWMPNPIGGVLWGGIAAAWATAHIPWYVGITKTPEPYNIGTNEQNGRSEYDPNSAYWTYRTISTLVNLFYRMTIDDVLPFWERWEDKLYSVQPAIEKTALELYKTDKSLAIEYLTDYSCSKAIEAMKIAKNMIPKLITKITINDGGVPAKHEAYRA
jgi:dipeptidase